MPRCFAFIRKLAPLAGLMAASAFADECATVAEPINGFWANSADGWTIYAGTWDEIRQKLESAELRWHSALGNPNHDDPRNWSRDPANSLVVD
jgi:hypothetical protein